MQKNSGKHIIIFAVILSVFVNVFFSRWITAKISTLPLLNRLNLLDPQAPIVIRETVETRVNSEGEIRSILENLRSRTSQLVIENKSGFEVLGSVLNFTSDGLVATVNGVLPAKRQNLKIRLSSGKILDVEEIFEDAETGVVFLKTSGSGFAAAALLDSQKARLGDRLLIFSDSAEGIKYYESQVNFLPEEKDKPFGFQDAGVEAKPGAVVANYKGEILGIWNNGLIVSEKIKAAFDRYLMSLRSEEVK